MKAIFIGDLEIKSGGPYSIENEPIKPKKTLLNCEMTLPNGVRVTGKGYLNNETNKIEFAGLESGELDT